MVQLFWGHLFCYLYIPFETSNSGMEKERKSSKQPASQQYICQYKIQYIVPNTFSNKESIAHKESLHTLLKNYSLPLHSLGGCLLIPSLHYYFWSMFILDIFQLCNYIYIYLFTYIYKFISSNRGVFPHGLLEVCARQNLHGVNCRESHRGFRRAQGGEEYCFWLIDWWIDWLNWVDLIWVHLIWFYFIRFCF